MAGNLNTNIPQPPDPQRVVRVLHCEQNPQGFLFARGQAICIGTGKVAGWVWKKTGVAATMTGWAVDIQPTAGSNAGSDGVGVGGGAGLAPQP